MTPVLITDRPEVRKFEAARLWQSNVYGATVAGLAGSVVLCVVAGIVVYMAPVRDIFLTAGVLIANMIIGLLLWFPGNLVAVHPYAVEIEEGMGLRLLAPLKTLYVPLGEVKDVRRSYLHLGWVVRLSRRQGALTRFYIHRAFGR